MLPYTCTHTSVLSWQYRTQIPGFTLHNWYNVVWFVRNVVTASLGEDESLLVEQSPRLNAEDKELLNVYHHSFDDSKVDISLILELLHKIHSSSQEGRKPRLRIGTRCSTSEICSLDRVPTAQGKQGKWPKKIHVRENTGNLVKTQGILS